MGFYTYRQNNSGGYFDTAVPLTLIVEAPSSLVADAIAQDHGVYFNDYSGLHDCPCCWTRWSEAWEEDEYAFDGVGPEVEQKGAKTKVVYIDGKIAYHEPGTYMGREWDISDVKF